MELCVSVGGKTARRAVTFGGAPSERSERRAAPVGPFQDCGGQSTVSLYIALSPQGCVDIVLLYHGTLCLRGGKTFHSGVAFGGATSGCKTDRRSLNGLITRYHPTNNDPIFIKLDNRLIEVTIHCSYQLGIPTRSTRRQIDSHDR